MCNYELFPAQGRLPWKIYLAYIVTRAGCVPKGGSELQVCSCGPTHALPSFYKNSNVFFKTAMYETEKMAVADEEKRPLGLAKDPCKDEAPEIKVRRLRSRLEDQDGV